MMRLRLCRLRVSDRLDQHAWKRGMRPEHLIEQLIATIVSDDLIDAVLDDRIRAEPE